MSSIYVVATLGVGGAILTESALSFLGIGVQPPTPSWGNILTQAKDNIEGAWWLTFYPGLAIFLTVMGYNLLGEGQETYSTREDTTGVDRDARQQGFTEGAKGFTVPFKPGEVRKGCLRVSLTFDTGCNI